MHADIKERNETATKAGAANAGRKVLDRNALIVNSILVPPKKMADLPHRRVLPRMYGAVAAIGVAEQSCLRRRRRLSRQRWTGCPPVAAGWWQRFHAFPPNPPVPVRYTAALTQCSRCASYSRLSRGMK